MRLRLILALFIAVAAAGCSAAATPQTPSPSPLPSKACGGFHIVIDNRGHADAAVRLNDVFVNDVLAGRTLDIAQWGQYHVPPMPWDLKVTRSTDGAVLLTAHLVSDGTDGRRVEVGDAPVAEAALAGYTC